ncbi:MAG: flagellin modification protein, PseA [Candidatus Tectimicrobiota bacterium]|nr:MAG: flagellin modification protein, PseA [Candidatus Tectomicrobia bacterium]
MRYCCRCILPETRPHLRFDARGVCNACTAHELKGRIDWQARERAFREVVQHAKARRKRYDCVIPVSGGKDSTWQVVTCLRYGLHPLAVTWKSPARTELGARNLANLVSLGVDHLDFQVNPRVEKTFMYQAFVRCGDPAIPMHLALFNLPLRIAVAFDIPLVVWGENSAFEYGGREEERYGFRLDGHWIRTYGATHGTTAQDWVSEALSPQDLTPYTGPSDEELARHGVLAIFLGYYFPWDPAATLAVAQAHGFTPRAEGPKTGYYAYADIDDDFISIHHYLKWYKFGFTRTFDNLSLEIRHGRLSREQALAILRQRGEEIPHDDIARFCAYVGIRPEAFWAIAERFRNRDIWVYEDGVWKIKDFLIPDWPWR